MQTVYRVPTSLHSLLRLEILVIDIKPRRETSGQKVDIVDITAMAGLGPSIEMTIMCRAIQLMARSCLDALAARQRLWWVSFGDSCVSCVIPDGLDDTHGIYTSWLYCAGLLRELLAGPSKGLCSVHIVLILTRPLL